jgi:DNA replication and repair protein RecF
MGLTRLDLQNFRIFREAHFEPDPEGTTVLLGPNGTGKTTVLEAVAYLASARSFRGATKDTLVRQHEAAAYLHGTARRSGRDTTIDAAINRVGPGKMLINKQAVQTKSDLASALTVTTFTPDDILVVRGGPSGRRDLLDDALAVLSTPAGQLIETVERIVRQRGALLKQAKGKLSPDIAATLDIWDERLAASGSQLIALREELVNDLQPQVHAAYVALATEDLSQQSVTLTYTPSFSGDLREALEQSRADDLRRAQTTIGPHRDDLAMAVNGRDARTQASQGEQRCLALSIRLALHQFVTAHHGRAPTLLLDDVFSELDPDRARRLVAALPEGQTLISSAVPLPPDVRAATVIDVATVGVTHG